MRAVRLCAIAVWLGASPAFAQLSSVLVVSGLSSPVSMVQDPTQANVLFVVEQGGRIRVVRNGALESTDFLDLTTIVLSGGERGLLGLAFAPDYATSGRFFVNYTRKPDGHTVVARYRRSDANPLSADPASRLDLRWPSGLKYIPQPFANHNAGDLVFGSDGYLYVPLGDGGSGNDPDHRAQNPGELLGKMLRIDVNVPDGDLAGYVVPPDNPFIGHAGYLPEIWAFGLRNPFRVSVDEIARGGTGAIVMGDVGQNACEEIDYEPFGVGGRNYGWRDREGAHANVTTKPPAYTPLTDPIAEYSHTAGNCITGGVVYRGASLGVGFFGRYFFADYGTRRIWSLRLVIDSTTHQATATQLVEHTSALGGSNTIGSVTGFGLGANCEVYFVNYSGGQLRRIVNAGGPAAQCPTSPDPFLSSGGGVFVGGTWVTRNSPLAAGAGLAGIVTSTCTTARPAANWVCLNGNWLPPWAPQVKAAGGTGTGGTASTGGTGGTGGSGTGGTGTATCKTIKPAANWVCVNGNWLPPWAPQVKAAGGTSTGGAGGTGTGGTVGSTGGTGAATCTTIKPGANWVCVKGNWLPPWYPLP